MKRLITGALALLLSVAASATTLNPVQLLNPTGSSSGQAIVSTGASTAPAWSSTYGSSTFTGDLTVSEPSAALIMNDTSGSGFPQFVYRSSGVNKWIVFDAPSTHVFSINRYVGGVFQDAPITISNSTGAVTMLDGITGSPISGSTGAFTTLAASSTVSGAGFSTYLASPPAIGGTTPAAGAFTTLNATTGINSTSIGAGTPSSGAFTTLSASGTFTPSQTAGIVGTTTNNNANAGAVGEYVTSSIPVGSAVTLTTGVGANVTSISLTAGDWDVWGLVSYSPGGSTVVSYDAASISTTSATMTTGAFALGPGLATGNVTNIGMVAPQQRLLLSATTTVFLVAQSSFTTSTQAAYGFIAARRRR